MLDDLIGPAPQADLHVQAKGKGATDQATAQMDVMER
jgi:hypothetical protein